MVNVLAGHQANDIAGIFTTAFGHRNAEQVPVMTAENILIVDEINHFPSFCKFSFKESDPSTLTWIDFWAVEPGNNQQIDYARGHKYADEAIRHVRATGQPVFVECVLIFMGIKLREGKRSSSALEHGFIDYISKEFPGAMDKALSRLVRRNPKKLNPMHGAIQTQIKEAVDRMLLNLVSLENRRNLSGQLD